MARLYEDYWDGQGVRRRVTGPDSGAFTKLGYFGTQVEILVNLAPPDLPKYGTSLDLSLAIILLQAAGVAPSLPRRRQGEFILMGEVWIHGEIRRVPGALSIAFCAKPGRSLCRRSAPSGVVGSGGPAPAGPHEGAGRGLRPSGIAPPPLPTIIPLTHAAILHRRPLSQEVRSASVYLGGTRLLGTGGHELCGGGSLKTQRPVEQEAPCADQIGIAVGHGTRLRSHTVTARRS
jgi:hypothetical protein